MTSVTILIAAFRQLHQQHASSDLQLLYRPMAVNVCVEKQVAVGLREKSHDAATGMHEKMRVPAQEIQQGIRNAIFVSTLCRTTRTTYQ